MEVLQAFERAGAILLDHHFVYNSGKHGPHYIDADSLFPDTELMNVIIDAMSEPWTHKTVEVVVGPPIGGLVLSTMAAARWPGPRAPELVWPTKDGKQFFFERAGFAGRLTGKRVLIFEDLLNTGGSVERVKEQVERHGGVVIGVTVMCNRGKATAESLGVDCLEAHSTV
ncbi:MAG TPA: phosphoribosyltransferase family protein, partial [Candidatus Saccharimonadales bacterium]|nr:phosphoribosyltransferase family protein [Candidatus Saccharimonadales bacterium]